MKITRVEVIPVDVPYHPGAAEWIAARAAGTKRTDLWITRVSTDEGITGIGEGGDVSRQAAEYLGKNPFEFLGGDESMPIHQALYDVMGKALGLPAYRLIGPRVRDRVPLAYWSCEMPAEVMAKEAERAVEMGYTTHKIKARPQWDIVEQVRQISERVPASFQLRIDPNDSFHTPANTVRIGRQLERYNIESLETPIPQENVDGYKHIRSHLDLPISLHIGRPHPMTALRERICDYFIIAYPYRGLAGTLKEAITAGVADMPVWIQIVGTGIVTAWVAHLGAVIPNATQPAVTLHDLRVDDLIQEPLQVQSGTIPVPERPGLGVELDEEALERYRVR
jgi:L-alanine-DL-glutamate epimerase-like enolase superfamily enzyme